MVCPRLQRSSCHVSMRFDYGADGIRSNAVNADRIRSGLLTEDMVKTRSKARGLSEQDYMAGNLPRP